MHGLENLTVQTCAETGVGPEAMTQASTFGRRGLAPATARPGHPKPAAHAQAPAPRVPVPTGAPHASGNSFFRPLLRFLFSFSGRIRRRDYWLANVSTTVAMFVWLWFEFSMMPVLRGNPLALLLLSLSSMAVGVAGMWSGFAVQLKRWHDRDKGWPWLFVIFIPFIGGLWAFVEIGCMDGTPGENRFGYSPKLGPAAVFA